MTTAQPEVICKVNELKSLGYRVFSPESLSTYFYVVQGEHIAYAQLSRLEGWTFSSVHKPCKHAGAGYRADSLPDALGYRPSWATGEAVQKYRNINEFVSKHWQALIER